MIDAKYNKYCRPYNRAQNLKDDICTNLLQILAKNKELIILHQLTINILKNWCKQNDCNKNKDDLLELKCFIIYSFSEQEGVVGFKCCILFVCEVFRFSNS